MGFNSQKKSMIADINVTPLVDVMLVLLVIFMITAPLMFGGIKLSLPKTKQVDVLNPSTNQVVLSFTKSGKYFVGKDRLEKKHVIKKIKNLFSKNKTDTLYVRADYSLQYGSVAKLMSFLKRGGIQNISLITEVEK
ncbi:MAG: biopolymer transporter ExbD [Halobacteriovoraceae bacterium]|nr:biopolymer transporter ExbD [Halobacteriovoraceae bacterium]